MAVYRDMPAYRIHTDDQTVPCLTATDLIKFWSTGMIDFNLSYSRNEYVYCKR